MSSSRLKEGWFQELRDYSEQDPRGLLEPRPGDFIAAKYSQGWRLCICIDYSDDSRVWHALMRESFDTFSRVTLSFDICRIPRELVINPEDLESLAARYMMGATLPSEEVPF